MTVVGDRNNGTASGVPIPSPLQVLALLSVVMASLAVFVVPHLVRTRLRLTPSTTDCKVARSIEPLRETPRLVIDLTGDAERQPSPPTPAVWVILRDILEDPLRTDISAMDLLRGIFRPFTFPHEIFPNGVSWRDLLLFLLVFWWITLFFGSLLGLPITTCSLMYHSFRALHGDKIPVSRLRVRSLLWLAPLVLLVFMNCLGLLPLPAFSVAYLLTMCSTSVWAMSLYAKDKSAAQENEQLAEEDDEPWDDSDDKDPTRVKRIPERTLHAAVFLGGWAGTLAAQGLFHHKVSKRKADFRNRLWGEMISHSVFVVVLCGGLLYLAVGRCEATLAERALRVHEGAVREGLMVGWYDARKTDPPPFGSAYRGELEFPLGTLALYGTKANITTVLVAGVTQGLMDRHPTVRHWVLAPDNSAESRRQVLEEIERALPNVRAELHGFFNSHGVRMVLFDVRNHVIVTLPQPLDPETYPTVPVPSYRIVEEPVFVLKRVNEGEVDSRGDRRR